MNSVPAIKCAGKATYTKRRAQEAVNRIWRAGRGRMRAYQCPECNYWHLSHK